MQYDIEKKAYYNFCNDFRKGLFGAQRLGQAFYNKFNLHKLSDQTQLSVLYESDGSAAKKLIKTLFRLH